MIPLESVWASFMSNKRPNSDCFVHQKIQRTIQCPAVASTDPRGPSEVSRIFKALKTAILHLFWLRPDLRNALACALGEHSKGRWKYLNKHYELIFIDSAWTRRAVDGSEYDRTPAWRPTSCPSEECRLLDQKKWNKKWKTNVGPIWQQGIARRGYSKFGTPLIASVHALL